MHPNGSDARAGRRAALLRLATLGAATPVLAALPPAAAVATTAPAVPPPSPSAYRETDHVRAYYRTAAL